MLCKAFRNPAYKRKSDNTASRHPHNTVCHFGETFAFFVAMLFITNIPESAEVTKNIIIMAITKKLTMAGKGRYSKKRNISASGLSESLLSAPFASCKSNQIALL